MKNYDEQISEYFKDIEDTLSYYSQFTEWHETHPECDGWGEQEYTELKIGSLDIANQITNLKRFLKLTNDESLISSIENYISKLTCFKKQINNILEPNEHMVDLIAVAKQRNALRSFNSLVKAARKRLKVNKDLSIASNDYSYLEEQHNNLDVGFIPESTTNKYYDTLDKILENKEKIKSTMFENFVNQLESASHIASKGINTPLYQINDIIDTITYTYDSIQEEYAKLQNAEIDTSSVEERYYEVLSDLTIVINYSNMC